MCSCTLHVSEYNFIYLWVGIGIGVCTNSFWVLVGVYMCIKYGHTSACVSMCMDVCVYTWEHVWVPECMINVCIWEYGCTRLQWDVFTVYVWILRVVYIKCVHEMVQVYVYTVNMNAWVLSISVCMWGYGLHEYSKMVSPVTVWCVWV